MEHVKRPRLILKASHVSTCTLFNDKIEQVIKAVLYIVDVRKIKKENTKNLWYSFRPFILSSKALHNKKTLVT